MAIQVFSAVTNPVITVSPTALVATTEEALVPTLYTGIAANESYAGKVWRLTCGGITGRDGIGEFEVLATDLNAGVAAVAAVTNIVSGGAITTASGIASADIKKVNAVTVTGAGTVPSPWGP